MRDISKEILLKAQEGDIKSFEIVYRETSGFVYNVAFRIVNNRQEAEEVTQEVFLNIYHKLKDFRFQSALKTWIYRITVNCAINHYKKMSRERNKRQEYGDDLNRSGETFTSPRGESGAEYDEEIVNYFLDALNPDQKSCVVLRSIEGLSYQDIAESLKININTVRSRLKRAREKLLALKKEVAKNEL